MGDWVCGISWREWVTFPAPRLLPQNVVLLFFFFFSLQNMIQRQLDMNTFFHVSLTVRQCLSPPPKRNPYFLYPAHWLWSSFHRMQALAFPLNLFLTAALHLLLGNFIQLQRMMLLSSVSESHIYSPLWDRLVPSWLDKETVYLVSCH